MREQRTLYRLEDILEASAISSLRCTRGGIANPSGMNFSGLARLVLGLPEGEHSGCEALVHFRGMCLELPSEAHVLVPTIGGRCCASGELPSTGALLHGSQTPGFSLRMACHASGEAAHVLGSLQFEEPAASTESSRNSMMGAPSSTWWPTVAQLLVEPPEGTPSRWSGFRSAGEGLGGGHLCTAPGHGGGGRICCGRRGDLSALWGPGLRRGGVGGRRCVWRLPLESPRAERAEEADGEDLRLTDWFTVPGTTYWELHEHDLRSGGVELLVFTLFRRWVEACLMVRPRSMGCGGSAFKPLLEVAFTSLFRPFVVSPPKEESQFMDRMLGGLLSFMDSLCMRMLSLAVEIRDQRFTSVPVSVLSSSSSSFGRPIRPHRVVALRFDFRWVDRIVVGPASSFESAWYIRQFPFRLVPPVLQSDLELAEHQLGLESRIAFSVGSLDLVTLSRGPESVTSPPMLPVMDIPSELALWLRFAQDSKPCAPPHLQHRSTSASTASTAASAEPKPRRLTADSRPKVTPLIVTTTSMLPFGTSGGSLSAMARPP
eukprot:CAMPEP_0175369832 /NCGR_PEP_ID=MMETSP0095-20121207/20896_1 /TAXON_ID=311494 /ORGANISM="Alexandrium monilatum, Strain CCMP3105" /LENGTH=544 /DNA_ID=CAMNT_0016667963 /DNA_START=47 /DNA_END=1678 /DNA_ORIENTATION=+